MSLQEFLQALPADLSLCPIERKGVNGSTGKKPVARYRDQNLNGHQVVDLMEKDSTISAAGVWCGTKNNGLVILDVDHKLHLLKRDKSKPLGNPPVITSTREDAAKFVYRVPRELISSVTGLKIDGAGSWQGDVIWANQGVIAGVYPGNADGSPAGEYKLTSGSFDDIPEAPAWLVAKMRNAKPREGWISKGRTMRLTDRTMDQSIRMCKECLGAIPALGPGSYHDWVKLGMAVHSELPGEEGLKLWIEFSQKDDSYDDAEASCTEKWKTFKADGRLSFGTLSYAADVYDPDQLRFSEESKEIYEELRTARVMEWRNAVLSHEDVIKQAKEIQLLDNPSEINHKMNGLAIAAGYRDTVKIEELLLSQLEYERKSSLCTWAELHDEDFKTDFLIPDVLPSPSVVLLYGAGGDGKSMTSWALVKHVAMGLPFVVRGQLVPVKQGPVLILNGDQPRHLLKAQLKESEIPKDAPLHIQHGWQLKRYTEFCRLMEEIKPALVVIDSLIGCSSGDAFDENKSSFASPLYWLTKNNGEMFPATTIAIVHHANKTGGFRGTSSIRDAVDETWALKKPDGGPNSLPLSSRLITIEKSRSGRSGTCLIMNMEADLSFSVADFTPEVDETKTTPDGIVDRVLMKVRTSYPRTVTREELNSDPLVGGSVAGIQKALQRLVKKGLLEEWKEEGRYGKKHYKAVLARGEGGGESPPKQTPSPGTPPRVDNDGGQKGCPSTKSKVDTSSDEKSACPPSEPSTGAGSALSGQPDKYPHARTEEELNASLDQSAWDS